MGLISRLWDRSFFNRVVLFRPKLLYHGTTLSYYNREKDEDYYRHDSFGEKAVWFEKNQINAVQWASSFAVENKDVPVLVVVNARNLSALRRNWLLSHQNVWRPPYYRADNVKKKCAVMVKIEFKTGRRSGDWAELTDSCKKKIAEAQARALYL